MFADGYKYWLAYKTNTTSYYRCCRYISSKCPGRCLNDNGEVRNTTAHNHPPEPDRALVDKFRKSLTQRAANEKTELYAIYCDEATSRHSDAAMLYPFESAKSAMRKARRKQLPQTPNIVTDIVDILDSSDLFRVNSGSDKDSIYQKTFRLEDSVCMIFLHKKTVDLFGRIDEIHVDGTVEFVPESPPSYHLITIHAVQGYITAPVIYALVTAKTQSAYACLFAYIREDMKILPSTIVSDFDQSMQASLAYTFPEAVIKGSWFEYTDTVVNQTKNLNLQKETYKGAGASALRMLLVLPLLPAEYMSPGLESLKKWMKEKNIFSDCLASLCDYVEYAWLRSIGAEKMSIFGTNRGISNHIKNFNKELSSIIGREKPAIWVILESITQLATKIYVKVNKKMRIHKAEQSKVNGKQSPGRLQRKSEQFTEAIISSATQLWIKTPVHLRNPLQFLQLSSHCINDAINLSTTADLQNTRKISTTSLPCSPSILPILANWNNPKVSGNDEIQESGSAHLSRNLLQMPSNEHKNLLQSVNNGLGVKRNNEDGINVHSEPHSTYPLMTNPLTTSTVSLSLEPSRATTSDPPPLAFFPSVKRILQKRKLPVLSEPPPLVPIIPKSVKK